MTHPQDVERLLTERPYLTGALDKLHAWAVDLPVISGGHVGDYMLEQERRMAEVVRGDAVIIIGNDATEQAIATEINIRPEDRGVMSAWNVILEIDAFHGTLDFAAVYRRTGEGLGTLILLDP